MGQHKYKKVILTLLLVASLIAIIIAGCRQKVVGIVNGKEITRKEYEQLLEASYGGFILDELVRNELIRQLAKKENITATKDEIEAERMQVIPAREHEEFVGRLQLLENIGVRAKTIEKNYILPRLFMKKLAAKRAKLTEDKLNKYFKEHRWLYDIPERRLLRIIVVDSKSKAMELYSKLKRGGGAAADFSELARKHSLQRWTAERGGEMGWFSKQSLPEPLIPHANRIFKVKVGEVLEPIGWMGLWAILKVDGRRPAEKVSYQDVKALVLEDIIKDPNSPYHKYYEQLWADLRKGANVKILIPKFASIEEQYKPLPEPRELWME